MTTTPPDLRLRSRLFLALVVLAMLAAACTDSAGTTTTAPTTTTTSAATTATTGPVTTTTDTPPPSRRLPAFPDDDVAFGIDPDVRIGRLDNGLTYYIRENPAPGDRAQLKLAIRAGSVLEDDDQIGAAHFVEHLLFNGTEGFPEQELILTLQRFGAEFGPEINAFTSFDETVYELEVPTDDPEIVATALDVLAEWASRALLDPDEVEAERGVLLEEWRLRSQSADGRYFEGVSAELLAGTDYEGRGPLAGPDEVASITAEALRRFYDNWYRPELMGVIAVGDFDADGVESLVRERFEQLGNAADAPERMTSTTEAFDEPAFFVLADPEVTGGFAELNYPMPAVENGTIGASRQELALSLAFDIMVTRLQEDALRGDAPFFEASFAANPFVDAQRTPGLGAFSDPDELEPTAGALLTEVRRSLLHGFSAREVDRAVADLRRAVQAEYDSRGSKQDTEYADEYLDHFLTGQPIPPAQEEYDTGLRLLDEVTAEQLHQTLRATVGETNPLVILVAPEMTELPGEDALAALVDRVAASEPEPRPDGESALDVLLEPPEPAAIVSRSATGVLGAQQLVLDNGATVILRQTDIAEDTVTFGASSPGGWSLLDPDDATEAQLAGNLVTQSGVGAIDQVELDRYLSGRAVTVVPFVTELSEGMFGEVTTGDLETMFQLINLYMSRPRMEQVALDALVDELRPVVADLDADPNLALNAALIEARYDGDRRYFLPTVEEVDTFDLARSLEIYRERFGNASDFTFVFAGDFDPDTVERLSRSYLGTLPGTGATETYVDQQPDAPPGATEFVVEAGTGELAAIAWVIDNEIDLQPETRLQIQLLELILRQRLTETIREDLSATYSPLLSLDIRDDPTDAVLTYLQVSADPDRLDEVDRAVQTVLADVRSTGPTGDELSIAQEQLIRDFELVSNSFWIETLRFYAEHPDEDPEDVFRRFDRITEVSEEQIRDLARILLPANEYIEGRLVPVGG